MVRNGTVGKIIGKVVEKINPESIYFAEIEGLRKAVIVVDLSDASAVSSIAEPWYLNFEAY